MKKQFFSMLLALIMVFSLMTTAFASAAGLDNFQKTRSYAQGQFADVSAGSWYAANVAAVYELELLNGTSSTAFSPNGNVSLAEAITLVCRLHSIYYTGSLHILPGTPWYQPYVDYAIENGIIRDGMFSDYTAPARRSEFAMILAAALPAAALEKINSVNAGDILDVAAGTDWGDAVYRLYNAGILVGSDAYGTFYPDDNIKRSEMAAIATRMADPDLRIVKTLAANANTLCIGNSRYSLGMTEDALLSAAGKPDEILLSFADHTWYVFGTDTYQDFFMAAVDDGVVTSLVGAGVGFRYLDCQIGTSQSACEDFGPNVTAYIDHNDNHILHAVMLRADGFLTVAKTITDKTCADESRINFHLVNAFRVYHEKSVLRWSDQAATAARLHSQDMADQNFFSHVGSQKTTPGGRMEAQGILFGACGENCAAGYYSGLEAYNGLVNSRDHRINILSRFCDHLGVGFGYNTQSDFNIYCTQDYFLSV